MTPNDMAAHLGIQELYSRYCFAYDNDELDRFADCFVADAVFAVGSKEFTGDEIRMIASRPGRPRHHYLNLWVREVEGDRAGSSAYLFLVERETGLTVGYGDYHDVVQRGDDGRWRFVRRDVEFLWQTPEELAAVARVIGESS